MSGYYQSDDWLHDKGYECFEREIITFEDFREAEVRAIHN